MNRNGWPRLCMAALLGAAFLYVAGCGGGSTDPSGGDDPPDGEAGTVTIDPEPDDIDAPWTLTYPGRFIYTGNGDSTMTDLPAGEWTLTWGAAVDYDTPYPETQTLAEGGSLDFTVLYEEIDYPTGFVTVQAGIFPMGSPESELGRQIKEYEHQVELTNSFQIMKTEVTNGQYRDMIQCPGTAPCPTATG